MGKKHKMWHVPLSEKEGKFNGKSSPTVSSLWKMDSHFLAFLENRKRVGTASLENLHRRNFVEEGRTSILLTIAKVSHDS